MSVVDAEGRPARRSYLDYLLGGAAPPHHGDLFVRIMAHNFLPAPAVMLRRSAIVEVGGYDESLFYEDFDMWLRLSFRFHFTYLPGRLVRYRAHESSMSRSRSNQPRMNKTRTHILTKWCDCRPGRKATSVWCSMRLIHIGATGLENRSRSRAALVSTLPCMIRPGRAAELPGGAAGCIRWPVCGHAAWCRPGAAALRGLHRDDCRRVSPARAP